MADSGAVEYVAWDPGGDLAAWTGTFLRIEASGWKGQEGTALACEESGRVFFEAIITEASRRGRLLFFALHHGGEPIALSCYFRAGRGCFWFKPAFDERFARFSPGLLLEAEITRRLHAIPGIEWVDSCTSPDNEMMNGLWVDRRALTSMVISTGRGPGDLLVSARPVLRWLKRRLSPREGARPAAATPAQEEPGEAAKA